MFGVAHTFYSVNGAALTTYTAPFVVTPEGYNSVSYWSVDMQGNAENTQTATLKIDKTPPASSSDADGAWHRSAVNLNLTTTDLLSGTTLGSCTFYRVNAGVLTTYGGSFDLGTEGDNTIEYFGRDIAGNVEATKTATVRIDHTPPITSTDATSGATTASLTATDALSGVGITYYSLDGSSPETTYTGPFATPEHTFYQLKFYSKDAVGNAEPVQTIGLNVDTTPPTTTSDIDSAWHPAPFAVTLNAVDSQSGIANTFYQLNGGEVMTYAGPFDVTASGATTVTYWSVDDFSNVETPTVQTLWVDPTAPVSSCNADSSWHNTTQTITITAGDAVSGLAHTYYRVNGGATTTYTTGAPVSANGTNTLEYWSVDVAGNVEATESALVKIDRTPPVTNSNIDGVWKKGNFSVTLPSGDFGMSGVAYTYYRINAGVVTTYTGTFTVYSNGTTQIHYWSVDVAGNVEATNNGTIMLDNTAPSTATNADSAWHKGSFVATLSATDNVGGSGLDSIFYLLNGVGPSVYTTGVAISTEGTNTFKYFATDQVQNQEATHTAYVKIDNSPPVSGSNIDGDWHAGHYTVSLSSADTMSGVKRTYYQIGAGAVTLYTAQFDVTRPGFTTVSFWSEDNVGNVEATKTATVKVDATPPVTTSNVAPSYTTTASVALSSADAEAGVAWTRYRVDAGAWATGTVATVPVSSTGTHTVDFYSADAVGNVEGTRTVAFVVLRRYDQADPTLAYRGTWSTDSNAAHYLGSATYTKTAGSSVSAIVIGTRLDWTTYTGSDCGIAQVSVDGGAPVDVDLYAASRSYQQLVWGVSGLADSTHTIVISWTGRKNGAATDTKVGVDAVDVVGTLTADATPPTTTSNADSAWHRAPVTLSLTATDTQTWVAGTFYRINGGAWTPYLTPFAVVGDGLVPVDFYSRDGAGNTEATKTATVRLDNTAPVSADDAPAAWVKTPVSVTITATDSQSGVGTVYSTIDAGSAATYTAPLSLSAEGTHTVSHWSVDAVGNVEAMKSATVRIDNTPPVSGSNADAVWHKDDFLLSLAATDALSGPRTTYYRIGAGATTTYTAPIDVTAEGTTTVSFWSKDVAGNVETTKSATVLVDKSAPVTTSNADTAWHAGSFTMTLTASDALSRPDVTFYRIGAGAPTTYTAAFAVTTEGVDTIAFWSVDHAGNVESAQTATVHIDATAPTSTSSVDGAWHQGPVSVSLSSSDPLSGVGATSYRFGLPTPPPAPTRYEQTVPVIGYTGTWTTYANVNHSGGSYAYAGSSATATISFAGTSLAWITAKSTSYGKAAVRLDGTLVATIDLYAAANTWRQSVWSVSGLPDALHTVSIAWTGQKNAASTGTFVGVDAFDIVGTAVAAGSDGTTPYAGPFLVSAEGTTTVMYHSVDIAGNAETMHSALVKIDDTPPATTSNADGITHAKSFSLTLDASDQLSGVSETYLSVNGEAAVPYTGAKTISDDGTNTVQFWSVDAAGNQEPTRTATVLVDHAAPVTTSNADGAWHRGSFMVSLTAADTMSTATTTFYGVNGAAMTTYTAPFAVTAEGTDTVAFYSVDGAGNAEATQTATVTIDDTAPTSSSNADAAWHRGSFLLSLDATDALSGTAGIVYLDRRVAGDDLRRPLHDRGGRDHDRDHRGRGRGRQRRGQPRRHGQARRHRSAHDVQRRRLMAP